MAYRGGGGPSMAKEGQVYVGNLRPDVRTRDIEDIFYKCGKINFVNLKTAPNGIPFAFVEFDDPRDAEDAIRERDGYNYDGYLLRVELPKAMGGSGRPPRGGGGGRSYGGGGDRYGGGDCYGDGDRYGGGGGRGGDRSRAPPLSMRRGSDYRVEITDLPKSASWQDLKDHMREAGDIFFADIMPDGTGIIEYVKMEDMKYAVKKLHDTKFRSHEGEVSYIRVREDPRENSGRRNRSRSPRSRSRS